ncbi:hypothetical protein EIK56_17985 [Sphingomonas sp. C8-2]|nr:hypothetical protein EIK56_17985 [Sphingomonas sp. C8-2]
MKAPTPLQQRRMSELLAMLSEVARKGAPCPNNTEIQDRIDLSNGSEVQPLFHRLELAGVIKVERTGCSRRVTIVETGMTTGWTAIVRGRPGYAGVRGPGDSHFPIEGFRGDLPPERYLDRDPCPRCGVRGDLGCAHSRRLAA